jgi:hypothetical protein
MIKKMLFPAFLLVLALTLPTHGKAGQRCTIQCPSAPAVRCSSEAGNCQISYGAYDYIICDDIATQCPL